MSTAVREHDVRMSTPAPQGGRRSTPAPRLWIFSARADLLLFTLPALLALTVVALSPQARTGESPEWVWWMGVLLVDVAHVWSTSFLTYFDRTELARYPARYALVPALGWVGGVVLYALGGATSFWRCLAYLAVFHFVRQQYGWLALYRAREKDPSRLGAAIDGAAIYAATLYPLLYWHANLPRRFHWFLPGDFLPGLPALVARLALAPYLLCLCAYVLRALWQWRSGRCVAWGKHLLLAGTAATWYVGIVASNGDYAFTLCNVLVHGIPYAALVFSYGRHVAATQAQPRPSLAARLLGGSPAAALPRFLGCMWLLALLEELLWDRGVWHERPELFGSSLELSDWHVWLVPLLALPQLSHYLLDGLLWRRGQNPELRRWLAAQT
ncbi:MAG: hypothetical protein RL033_4495 [Pseudomonadota bacterium]